MSKEVDGVLIEGWVEKNLLSCFLVEDLPLAQDTKWKYTHKESSPFTTKLFLKRRNYGPFVLEAIIEGPSDVPYVFVPFGWEAYDVKEDREVSNLRFVVLEPTVATAYRQKGTTRGKIDLGKVPDHLTIYPPLMLLPRDQYLADILTRSLLPVSVIASVSRYHTEQAWRKLIENEPSCFKWIDPTIAETLELAKQLTFGQKIYY